MFTVEKTCEITNFRGVYGEDLIVPEYIDKCRVVSVKSGLFRDQKFRNVNLPSSLINFDHAFWACEITGKLSLNMPSISQSAFWLCKINGELILPECLTQIGEFAFYGSTFTGKLVIPKNVRIIEQEAFCKCPGLTCLEFEDGSRIEKIASRAFAGCDNLGGTVKFPDTLHEIDNKAFFDVKFDLIITSPTTRVHKNAFKQLD